MDSIRLIGIDVDGTLVGASGVVSSRVWEAAARARAAGIRLVLCSGRPAFGIAVEYARTLDPDGWHVFQNGASIVHLGSAESLSVRLPLHATDFVIEQSRRTGRVLELYSDREYVTESASEWAREHAELLGVEFVRGSFDRLREAAVRAQWLVSPQEADEIVAAAPNEVELAKSSSPLMPHTTFIGLTRAGVSKGSALRTVAERLGIPLARTMYIGDAGNDLSAMRIAGCAVAMANADEAVIAAADYVAGHVDTGGLADAIELALDASIARRVAPGD
jgi:Cof subfamily protein (haloacid dehalogenase superfamily)